VEELMVTVAAVQATPVFLDREATTDKACALVKEAAAHGAELIVFPESFIPAYPDWVWRTPAWSDTEFVRRLYANAVGVPGPALQRLQDAAAEVSAYVVLGVTEIEGGSLYNTLLYLGPDGRLLQRHRKLMPTGGERTVWGMGDGSELGVVPTPFGVVGGLLCWENYMPLARAAIYAQHCDIYLAPTWDNSDTWVATLRHIAKEGGQFVIGVAPLLRGSDVPEDLRGTIYGLDDDWMSRGHTTIVCARWCGDRRAGSGA
jgi:nitrilase